MVLTSQTSREKAAPRTIRDLRHERGMRLDQAAEFAGLHKARLSELERGERPPTVRELNALAATLGRPLRVVMAIVEDVA